MACGDLNRDQLLNEGDFETFRLALGSSIGQTRYNALADYDGDGRITYADYTFWYRCYQAGLDEQR
jgi:hypothetical protein